MTVPEAARMLRNAGGLVSLAHPHRLVEDHWIPELVEMGIQGIEVYHSDHDSRVTQKYLALVERHGLLATGGSDCHGLRKAGGPLIGTVQVPDEILAGLKSAFAEIRKR